jgi:hypothetical protein
VAWILQCLSFQILFMATSFKLAGSWQDVKEKLKEINLDLTDEDLAYEPGREDELLERLERKMNKNKAEIKALIESLSFTTGIAS